MQAVKTLTRTKYAIIFLVVGAVLAIFGFIFRGFAPPGVFDLPWFLVGLGFIALVYGVFQLLRRKVHGNEVEISGGTAKKFLTNNAIMLALIVLVIAIIFIEPRFLRLQVVFDVLTISSTKLIIALGICFTLLIAGTDLSAGRMVGLAGVIAASMLQTVDYANRFFPDLPQLWVGIPIVLALIACMIFGALNGFLVARFDMHPFIATLAVQVIIYGACSLYFDMPPNNSQPIGGIRPDFAALGQLKVIDFGKIGYISILVPIAIIFAVVIWFVLNKTVFGKNVYAIGGNREAAVVSGVNVFATTMGIFILAGFLYGVAGVLESARTAGATNQYGAGYELDAIAACVVGGVSLNGGVGKIGGIVSGVLIFSVISYGLQFINVSPMWQQVFKGVIIAVAVAIDLSKYRRK